MTGVAKPAENACGAGAPRELALTIVRHGQTPGNAQRRYVGSLDDQPLSEQGRAEAEAAPHFEGVGLVYVSALRRTHETAQIMFPDARQVQVPGIEEMDFGAFTGRSADEMADDLQYRSWVDSYCEDRCPQGEARAEFAERVCSAMEALLREAAARGEREVFVVAHGGTLMSFLWKFSGQQREYYEWLVGNCCGYRMDVRLDGDSLELRNIVELPGR